MYYIAHLVMEACLAALMLCAVFVIIVAIKRALTRQPHMASGVRVFTVVAAYGDAEGLEQAVRSLLRGAAPVMIADCGLSPDARRVAEILARDCGGAELCLPGEIPKILEDCGWTEENTHA